MCGISGILEHGGDGRADRDLVAAMAATLEHRGPDDSGMLLSGPCGFGFRRLSIIDLEGGHQPVANEDGTIWVQLNGEIYNYRELRSTLIAKGHTFSTNSDTETIVHGYEEWGDDVVDHLNGMFAFAVWDSVRQRLLLARDHLGVKPLYWHDTGSSLRFGSEMRAILVDRSIERSLDPDAVRLFLHFGYVPAPSTILASINKLRPGHRLIAEPGRAPRVERFWTPEVEHRNIGFQQAASEYREIFGTAIDRQMVSDVPVGCLLSGGMDSAMVLAEMRRRSDAPISTFTIGFDEPFAHDEAADAAETAALFDADHHPITVTLDDFNGCFGHTIDHLEEPVLSQSTFAYTLLNQHVRNHVKVVLTGQGADEPWAGYDRYLGERYGGHARWLFGSTAFDAIGRRLPGADRLRRAGASLGEADPISRFAAIHQVFSPAFIAQHGSDHLTSADGDPREAIGYWQRGVAHLDPFSQLLFVDTRMSLADDLLLYGDKLSMASSVEARVPFLDREVIDYIESLPPSAKLRRTTHKAAHKRAGEQIVPREITRRKKRGFATPVDRWFANELAPMLENEVFANDSVCSSLLDPGALRSMFDEHRSGTRNHRRQLTALLSLELATRSLLDTSGLQAVEPRAAQPQAGAHQPAPHQPSPRSTS